MVTAPHQPMPRLSDSRLTCGLFLLVVARDCVAGVVGATSSSSVRRRNAAAGAMVVPTWPRGVRHISGRPRQPGGQAAERAFPTHSHEGDSSAPRCDGRSATDRGGSSGASAHHWNHWGQDGSSYSPNCWAGQGAEVHGLIRAPTRSTPCDVTYVDPQFQPGAWLAPHYGDPIDGTSVGDPAEHHRTRPGVTCGAVGSRG